MTQEQLSMQIVAINDAIQILARNQVTTESHSYQIDGLVKKYDSSDKRIREIESLIHQSCDLQTRERAQQIKEINDKISDAFKEGTNFTKWVAGVMATTALIYGAYIYNYISDKAYEHSLYEQRQDDKSEKIYTELFGLMREVKDAVGQVKADVAIISNTQQHYKHTLETHIRDEEKRNHK